MSAEIGKYSGSKGEFYTIKIDEIIDNEDDMMALVDGIASFVDRHPIIGKKKKTSRKPNTPIKKSQQLLSDFSNNNLIQIMIW